MSGERFFWGGAEGKPTPTKRNNTRFEADPLQKDTHIDREYIRDFPGGGRLCQSPRVDLLRSLCQGASGFRRITSLGQAASPEQKVALPPFALGSSASSGFTLLISSRVVGLVVVIAQDTNHFLTWHLHRYEVLAPIYGCLVVACLVPPQSKPGKINFQGTIPVQIHMGFGRPSYHQATIMTLVQSESTSTLFSLLENLDFKTFGASGT